ncbi:MAG: ISAs1 family transposase [Myxococcaceae bacterium]
MNDSRHRQGRRWNLETLLTAVLLGLMAGCQSLAEVESLTAKLSLGIRRRLRLPPMKDTTLRDALVRLHPLEIRGALWRMVKAAERRKALEVSEGLPFHAVSMDGKWSAIPYWDHHYAQMKTADDGKKAFGMVRTINSVLVTSPAKVVLDTAPVPAETNEMGIFPHAFDTLLSNWGGLFEMVMYDAGAASQDNMAHVVNAGKHFLFCLADERWLLFQKAQRILGHLPESSIQARSEETVSNSETLVRSLYIATAPKGYKDWKHIRTILRVHSQTFKDGVRVSEQNKYLVSSKEPTAITGVQWLALIRSRWGVENNLHWTLDAIFKEDDRTWIEAEPRGTVVVMVLRRIAYTLLALFRSVTQRSEEARRILWRDLVAWVYDTLIAVADGDLQRLRQRGAKLAFN